jgi:hypothetical protein
MSENLTGFSFKANTQSGTKNMHAFPAVSHDQFGAQ